MPATNPPDDLGRLIGQVRRQLWLACSQALDQAGSNLLVWQVLARLETHGALAQCRLAELTAQHPAGLSRLITDLEDRGLVTRERDAGDKRRLLVAITEAGRSHHASHLPLVRRVTGEQIAPLSGEERGQLAQLLRKIIDGAGPT